MFFYTGIGYSMKLRLFWPTPRRRRLVTCRSKFRSESDDNEVTGATGRPVPGSWTVTMFGHIYAKSDSGNPAWNRYYI